MRWKSQTEQCSKRITVQKGGGGVAVAITQTQKCSEAEGKVCTDTSTLVSAEVTGFLSGVPYHTNTDTIGLGNNQRTAASAGRGNRMNLSKNLLERQTSAATELDNPQLTSW